MLNKIMLVEVNDIKVSVVQFNDYVWMGEPSFEVAIIDADDVKDIGRYYTEAEAVAKAEEIVLQAKAETEEVNVVAPVLDAKYFGQILEAYDFSIEFATGLQTEMINSMVGAFSKTVNKYIWDRYNHSMDNDYVNLSANELIYNNIGEFLELTMYRVNIYNKEFNKFFTYWMPKAIA